MKKIISFIVSVILIISIFALPSYASDYTRLYTMSDYVDIHNSEKQLIKTYKEDYFLPYMPHMVIDKDWAPSYIKYTSDTSLYTQLSVYNTSNKNIRKVQFSFHFFDKDFKPITTYDDDYSYIVDWEYPFPPHESYNLYHTFERLPFCHAVYVDKAIFTFNDGTQTIAKCDMWLYHKK